MKKFALKCLTLSTISAMLCACNGFFDKDNTPTPTALTNFRTELNTHLNWYSSVNWGVGSDYLKMIPAVGERAVFTASKDGTVTATSQANGNTVWRQKLTTAISAGVAASNGLIFLGTRDGNVYALSQADGSTRWHVQVPSEVLAPPAAAEGVVLVKTIDGQLTALDANNGHALWHYQQTEPALILRSGSMPQITGEDVVTGFANGNLAKLTLRDGSLLWQETVAIPTGSFAIQRMVDIDADPVVYHNHVYVATYQGKVSALALSTGKVIWTHDISSFTGLAVDEQRVYVADASSNLWAFDAESGRVDWKQTQLVARNITGPATIGNYVLVADQAGYLHWLNKQDGRFMARNHVNGFGVIAAPVVHDGNVYVLTTDGHLAAYSLN